MRFARSKITLRRSTICMVAAVAFSMCWFSGCDCDKSKEEDFPGFWVTCVGNKPTLMTYNSNSPVAVTNGPAGSFNPNQYDCTHPNSPQYKGSEKSAPFVTSGPSGPAINAQPPATTPLIAYIPQPLRDLPFFPVLSQLVTPACSSSFPDVLQTNHNESSVVRISTCPFQIKTTIPVVSRPLQVAITHDGSTALVTSFDNAINFINLATNKVTFTMTTGSSINPNGIVISADDSTAYVSSFNPFNSVILVIDLATHSIVKTLNTTLQYPSALTLTPDGSQLWVGGPLDVEVDVFDTLTNTLVTRLGVSLVTDIAFNPTGTRAYLSSAANSPGQVVAVDTATFKTLATYTVGATPSDLAFTYGNNFLIVNNTDGNSVSLINLVTGKVGTTAVGGTPSGIAFVQ